MIGSEVWSEINVPDQLCMSREVTGQTKIHLTSSQYGAGLVTRDQKKTVPDLKLSLDI